MQLGSIKIPESQIERTGFIELDEPCDKKGHEKYKLWHFNGEIVCPACLAERKNNKFEQKETEKQFDATAEGRRKFLYRHSIMHNKKLLDKGIRDFINKDGNESRVKNDTRKVVKEVLENNRNVFMVGSPGVGKTHLMIGMLKNINELNDSKKCLFVSVPRLYELIRKSYDNNYTDSMSEGDYIELLASADVLGLDDIGGELSMNTNKQASDFSSRILYSILNARESKTTLFTSNLSLDELSLILDERIISRIKSNMLKMDFNGITDKREYAYKLK